VNPIFNGSPQPLELDDSRTTLAKLHSSTLRPASLVKAKSSAGK
jgi:hypothetical protein